MNRNFNRKKPFLKNRIMVQITKENEYPYPPHSANNNSKVKAGGLPTLAYPPHIAIAVWK